jgi:hypothetical protein
MRAISLKFFVNYIVFISMLVSVSGAMLGFYHYYRNYSFPNETLDRLLLSSNSRSVITHYTPIAVSDNFFDMFAQKKILTTSVSYNLLYSQSKAQYIYYLDPVLLKFYSAHDARSKWEVLRALKIDYIQLINASQLIPIMNNSFQGLINNPNYSQLVYYAKNVSVYKVVDKKPEYVINKVVDINSFSRLPTKRSFHSMISYILHLKIGELLWNNFFYMLGLKSKRDIIFSQNDVTLSCHSLGSYFHSISDKFNTYDNHLKTYDRQHGFYKLEIVLQGQGLATVYLEHANISRDTGRLHSTRTVLRTFVMNEKQQKIDMLFMTNEKPACYAFVIAPAIGAHLFVTKVSITNYILKS